MKISQLKKTLTTVGPKSDDYRNLSNLYKSEKSARLCIAVYESQGLSFRSRYFLHIEMDYKGKILAIKDDYSNDVKKIAKFKKLVGKKVDLNSFKWDYEKIVHNRPVGVESSYTVGSINKKGKFVLYSKGNVSSLSFPTTYRTNGDKLADYRNYEATEIFLNLVTKYKSSLQTFKVFNDGITYYRCHFKVRGIEVSVCLKQFFDYSLDVRVYHPQKGGLKLSQEEVLEMENVITQFKTNKIDPLTSVKMITQGGGSSYCDYQVLSNEQIQVTVKFDGQDNRPRGKYNFVFDFKNKAVSCIDGQKSMSYIPKKVARYQADFDSV